MREVYALALIDETRFEIQLSVATNLVVERHANRTIHRITQQHITDDGDIPEKMTHHPLTVSADYPSKRLGVVRITQVTIQQAFEVARAL